MIHVPVAPVALANNDCDSTLTDVAKTVSPEAMAQQKLTQINNFIFKVKREQLY